MATESYQDAAYRELNILPPKTQQNKPTHGHLIITLKAIRATRNTIAPNLIGRFKMWGQTVSRTLQISQTIDYHIKCQNTTFYEYLRDMQVLKMEIIDRRNKELYGIADISLLLFLNKNIKHNWDSPLLTIDKVFPLFKQQKNIQLGEVQVYLEANFNIRVVESPGISHGIINNIETFGPHTIGVQMGSLNDWPSLPEEVTFKNLQTVPKIPSMEALPHQMLPQASHSPQPIYNSNRQRKPISIPEVIIKPPQRIIRIDNGKLDAELLKLELEAQQILGTTSNQKKQQIDSLVIEVQKVQLLKGEDANLLVSYPIIVKRDIMKSTKQLTMLNRKHNELYFDDKIMIENWIKLKDRSVSFQLKSKKAASLLAGVEVILRNIIEGGIIQLNNKGKKYGFITIKAFLKKEEQIRQNPKAKDVSINEFSQRLNSPLSPTHNFPLPLLLGVYIRQGSLIEGLNDRRYFKIRFKLQNEYFETAEQNLHWNYNLLCPFSGKLDQNICFQLWRVGIEPIFEGIAKLQLSNLNFQLNIQEESINPTVLSDCKLPIQDLRGSRSIGYLSISISVGTARQMSWKQQHQARAHPSREPFIRQSTESRAQYQGDSSERERRLDTKYTEDKMVGMEEIVEHNEVNLVETMTRFLQSLAEQSLKTSHLIKNIGTAEQMSKAEFRKILQPLVENNDQEVIEIVSLFFGEGSDVIDVVEFLKCFSSFVNFTEIIVEQRTAILQKVLAEVDKTGTHLDVLEQKLMKHSQFGILSRNKFRDLMKGYLEDTLVHSTVDIYCTSEDSTLEVSLFVSELKDVKFGRKLTAFDTKSSTFQLLIKDSVEEVLAADINAANQIPNSLTSKDLGVRMVCELLQNFKVEVSYWEALLLIESIKGISRQDVNLTPGTISSQTMFTWLNAIVESHVAANKSREQAKHNKTLSQGNSENIMVQQSMKSEKSQKSLKENNNIAELKQVSRKSVTQDDIVNIADLLKYKDKYQYTESQDKSKVQPQLQNQSKYSNLLPADSKFFKRSIDRGFIEFDRIQQKVKQNQFSETVKIPSILRYLKCQIVDLRLNASEDLTDLALQVELVNRHQVLLEFKRNKPVFFSSTILYEEVDVSNVDKYLRIGIKGLCFTLKHSGLVFCRGLIPIQDIFKLDPNNATTLKKTCIMYPKINNKIIFNLTLVQDRTPIFSEIYPTVYTCLMSLSLRSGSHISQVHLGIDGQIQHNNINLLQWYDLKLSSNNLSSKLQLAVSSSSQEIYQAEVSLQGFITDSSFTAEVPVNDQMGRYEGTVILRLAKNPEVQNLTPQGFGKEAKCLDLHIFIEKVISLTANPMKLEVFWAIFQAGRELSRTETKTLQIDNHLSCISLKGVELMKQKYNLQQQIQIRMIDANTNQMFAVSRLTVSSNQTKLLSFVDRFCCAQNKDKFPMRLGISIVGIQSNPKVKLDRIIKLFTSQNRSILQKELSGAELTSSKLRSILHDKLGYSYSEIGYILVALNEEDLKEIATSKIRLPSKGKTLELLSEFEFHDPERTGFVRREQLLDVLGISGLQEKNQLNVLDLMTRGRVSVDYMRYLCYEDAQLPSGGQSSFKEVYSSIDKIHENMLKRLNR